MSSETMSGPGMRSVERGIWVVERQNEFPSLRLIWADPAEDKAYQLFERAVEE